MSESYDPANLRQDYQRGMLAEESLPVTPLPLFRKWFEEACASTIPEPNAMTLATVDADGQPWSRIVLLKAYDEQGFVFYTNYESDKACHIAGNPRVALSFAWIPLERQVIITGTAEKVSTRESLAYFLSRPRGNRLGAWVSQQSKVISNRQLLEAKLEEMKQKFSEGEIPLPSSWGGIRVKPQSVEFWQGRPNRLHDRFRYLRNTNNVDAESWQPLRLQP